MKVNLLDYSGPDPAKPELIGSAWPDGAGGVSFSDPQTMELCCQLAADERGPVGIAEPERFLRSLPQSVSGSMLRAELIES